MLYIIIIFALFSIAILIKDYKNKYIWILITGFIGLSLAIFAAVLEISRVGNYFYNNNILFYYDYLLYMYIIEIFKISFSDITRLMNIGISMYLITVPLFVYEFIKGSDRETIFCKKNIIKILILSVFPIAIVWLYDAEMGYKIFIKIHQDNWIISSGHIKQIIKFVDIINKLVVELYLFYPLYVLFQYFIETKISMIKKQVLSLAASFLVLNISFNIFFLFGPFEIAYTNLFDTGFWIYNMNLCDIPFYYFDIVPIIFIFVMIVLLIILMKYRMVSNFGLFKEKTMNRNMRTMNSNIRDMMHSQKNILFSVKILAEQANNNYDNEIGKEAVNEIIKLSNFTLSNISRGLNSLKELQYRPSYHRIVDVIEMALNEVQVPKNIKIKKNYYEYEACSNIDFYHLMKSIVNIVQNSIEAINCTDKDEGIIQIEVNVENRWVYIVITDNGIGIKKQYLKKIFTEYYSTKSKQNNWGIGLSYVNKVINKHCGHIWVTSKEGEYTSFHILLDRVKGEHENNVKN
ncbi:hypothetical protein SH2C18_24000 [Clostridium sediminicola]|uniref:sensor histidine kinase n=1 Tax=Clostridium sediminicola TaxID=3114879 RepID=UPI0031F21724